MEWGMQEMLVEDSDGHRIRFGQNAPVSDREKSAAMIPQTIQIIASAPTAKEFQRLAAAVGWTSSVDETKLDKPLPAVAFAVVAEDTVKREVIGCAFLLGDNTGFYYVKDVMVHPDWQGKRIGTALMQEMTHWLEGNAPDKSSVWLHTAENLAPFYKQFGFTPAFGMRREMQRHGKNF